ncbi:MAG TPA: hypothetical protein VL989_00890 [Candidatus Sulfotelmatobacter sp.]|nr:hypothetical protein [Candidatus Sulfotelmatobacter sp.]
MAKKNSKKKPIKKPKTGKVIKTPAPKKEESKAKVAFARLPKATELTKNSWNMLWINKNLFIGIALIYGLLNLILVQGLAGSSEVSSLKSQISSIGHGHAGALSSSIGGFVVLLGSSGNGASSGSSTYQLFLGVITSLAIIWSLRQLYAGHKIRVRDSFYRGMNPLIPFILVLVVIGLELIPLLIGSSIYSIIVSNGIAVGWLEQVAALIIFLVLLALSVYWLIGTIFALYIATLPDMTPIKAIKTANDLVRKRRLIVLRKILFLPLVLVVSAAVIMLPIILISSFLAQVVFFVLTMFVIVAVNAYLYTLYREMLNEV